MNQMQTIPATHMLDVLCPMHLMIDRTGHVTHAGPTLRKILDDADLTGTRFLELFELRRPQVQPGVDALMRLAGERLHLALRRPPRTELKGVLMPLPEGMRRGRDDMAIVNLSFGISIVDAVTEFSLTNSDFAVTDMTVEMLYLVEAKSAAMAASRKLNQRLQGAKIAAEEKAYTDTLTGLKNRRAMDFIINRLLEAEQDFALMNVDLDHFKAVNDTLGHAAGDFVLQQVARIMVEETRSDDTIVRTGGDEFVLIFTDLTSEDSLSELAGRLITRLEQPIDYDGQTCRISASIGATMSTLYDRPSQTRMMEDADIALYAAKHAGRGRHFLHGPSPEEAEEEPCADTGDSAPPDP